MSADNGQGQPDGSNEAGAQVRGSIAEPRSGTAFAGPLRPSQPSGGRGRQGAGASAVSMAQRLCAEACMGLC